MVTYKKLFVLQKVVSNSTGTYSFSFNFNRILHFKSPNLVPFMKYSK